MQRNQRVLSLEAGAIAAGTMALLLAARAGTRPVANRSPYVLLPPAPTARALLLADRFDELNRRFSAAQSAYRSGRDVEAIDITGSTAELSESRHWLDKADAVDPDNYVARAAYMSVIETRWGGSQQLMQAFLEECRTAKLPADDLQVLESVVVEDQGWIHQFIDHDYAAAEAAYREGLADLRAAADGGDGYAQSELGRHYMIGIPGVLTPDARTGLEWFKKSAAQGNPAGLENLERARKLFGDSLGEK